MPKLSLLKSEADFAAFRKSKTFSSDLLKIRVHFRLNQNYPRFGFIISKKTLPKAAHRNLLKRRLKAALLKRSDRIHPVDILFLPTKALMEKKFSDVEGVLEKLLTQGRLWKS